MHSIKSDDKIGAILKHALKITLNIRNIKTHILHLFLMVNGIGIA